MSEEQAGVEPGLVSLVGAGPGDPGLLTVRAAERLREADVVFYDELVSPGVLTLARPTVELVNVGRRGHEEPARSQEDINQQLVAYSLRGNRVVRLKGGDPFIFGRGAEEATACAEAGIPFEVVPGISSAIAAPAYAGIPLTDRRHSASFVVVTGHKDPTRVSRDTRWSALAEAADTLVILMGMRALPEIVRRLLENGFDEQTPAAIIMNGTRTDQKVVEAPLKDLVVRSEEFRMASPAAVIIGNVVQLREQLDWFVPGPLAGFRVLTTRATSQVAATHSALLAAGAQPVSIPLVEIEGPSDWGPLDAALTRIENFDAVVFASENAVRFTVDRARETGHWECLVKGDLQVACVGPRTAQVAHDAGLPVHCVGDGGGEALLVALQQELAPKGRRFLLPRSEIGREDLVRGLAEAGGVVEAVVAYRTGRAEVDAADLRKRLIGEELDAVLFASPSAARYFSELLDADSRSALETVLVGAMGEATAESLREAGIEPSFIPERPGSREIVAALSDFVAGRR